MLQILGFSIQAEAQETEILVDQNFTGPFDSSQPISEFDLDREITRQNFTPSAGNLKAIEIFVANRFDPLSLNVVGVVDGQPIFLGGGIAGMPSRNVTKCDAPEILRYEFEPVISLKPGDEYAFDVRQVSNSENSPFLCASSNPDSYLFGVGYNGQFSEIGDYGFITYYEYNPLEFLFWLIPVVVISGSAGIFFKRRINLRKS